MNLSLPEKVFLKAYKEAGENTVIQLVVDGKKHPVLIYDVIRDGVTGDIQHVDFYLVRMDEEITARIPLEIVGESPAMKSAGGILNQTMDDLEVEALPANLPQKIMVDISGITELNQSIYVKDLSVPKNVTIVVDPETVVLTVTEPMAEEVIVAPVDVSAVKVETEEKKEARDKEKAAEGEEK
jgi:large subunit ribosomal protein L25